MKQLLYKRVSEDLALHTEKNMKVSFKIIALWCLIVLLTVVSTLRADSLADSKGFISIDCGLEKNSSIEDAETKLTYVSDDQFIDTGVNYNIVTKYATNIIFRQLLTIRSFPNGTRNCYTLRSLTVGSKYLVRAIFLYGNYDHLNKPPIFDIHLGVNYWDTINNTDIYGVYITEIIAVTTADYLQVCLINTDSGTPFISWLDLRQLNTITYPDANSTQFLINFDRLNFGAGSSTRIRYPNDQYDRIWSNYKSSTWKEISNRSTNWLPGKFYATPTLVMETAATSVSTKQSLDLSWTCSASYKLSQLLVVIHIYEIQNIKRGDLREFQVVANGVPLRNISITSDDLARGWVSYAHICNTENSVSLKATSNSTLPPLWNALELYIVAQLTEVPTYSEDVTAINIIKTNYQVKKGWSGDPCVPAAFSWTGVDCTIASTKVPRITGLNLSSVGLTGALVSTFGNLSALKSLDLSDNNLSGAFPASLDQLEALTYLDIRGNYDISTILPPGLQKKQQNGILTYKFGGITPPSKDKKSPVVPLAIAGVVLLLLIAVAIILVLCFRRRKRDWSRLGPRRGQKPVIDNNGTTANNKDNRINISKRNESYGSTHLANSPRDKNAMRYNVDLPIPNGGEERWNYENHQFSYKDLKKITNDFHNIIGAGGFGVVYMGVLQNGTQVAVKMRSEPSSQGVKEFLAEARNLTRVHHKYLVSLMGYCIDEGCMALVYEYMREGTLRDKITDNARPLTWKHRLRIAYESALGLEYLHKACNPPLIHRDVKSNNILLNANLEARIADFGLSKAFNNDSSCHVSTAIVGTPGYLDPEYYSSCQLSEKSDVFSFGVVLLEIVTGQPPTNAGPEENHVAKWARENLLRGDIESIVDPKMHRQYDINSVWKVTDLACKCTEHSSAKRPFMNIVAAELKESLELEISTEGIRNGSTTSI